MNIDEEEYKLDHSRRAEADPSVQLLETSDHAPDEAANKQEQSRQDELDLTARIDSIGVCIEATTTLIFEVQELRHFSNSDSRDSSEGPKEEESETHTSEIDGALARLNAQVEQTTAEISAIDERVETLCKQTRGLTIKEDWEVTRNRWKSVHHDASALRDELVEDKYLTVYRTVSKQADDMMQSLEKVFTQCQAFTKSARERYAGKLSISPDPSADIQADLNTFVALHNSLHQKSKYYIPSCERVLKVIESGIAQQRSLNGEVLRSHADMKSRWRNLKDQLRRTEGEMQAIQDLFDDLLQGDDHTHKMTSGHTPQNPSIDSSQGSFKSRSSSRRSSVSTSMRASKSSDRLTPSPQKNKDARAAGKTSPTLSMDSRAISPYRKMAARLRSDSKSSEGLPPLPDLSTSHSSRQSSQSPVSTTGSAASARATDHLKRPPLPNLFTQNRTSNAHQDTNFNALSPSRNLRQSTNGLYGARPNNGRPRQSLPSDARALTPTSRVPSGRHTPFRSSFAGDVPPVPPIPHPRNFTTPSFEQYRPTSPTFSATSTVSQSPRKPRPSSPNSRIPAPAIAVAGSFGKPHMKARPSQAFIVDQSADDAEEILMYRPRTPNRDDEEASTLMQRAFSPTPSTSAFTVASSVNGGETKSRRQSHIPRLSISGASTPLTSPTLSSSMMGRFDMGRELMTPEPTLRNRAARVSAIYDGTPNRPSSRMNFGVPSPSMSGQGYLNSRAQKSPAGSSNGIDERRAYSPRPSSRLGFGRSVSGRQSYLGTHSFKPPNDDNVGPYTPNSIDPLDVEIAQIVNSQPLFVRCERIDLPLNKAEAAVQKLSDRMASYSFGFSEKPVVCKLIERGPAKDKKVLAKVGGGWQELTVYLSAFQAH